MALYSTCRYSIRNIELSCGCSASSVAYPALCCYAALLVRPFISLIFTSYMLCMLRPDDRGKDIGSSCLRAYLSVLLVHPKGGSLGDTKVDTSYMGVVPGYAGSFRYARAPRSCRGSPRKVTTPLVRHSVLAVVSVVPHVRVRGRSSCKDVTPRMYFGVGHSPQYP